MNALNEKTVLLLAEAGIVVLGNMVNVNDKNFVVLHMSEKNEVESNGFEIVKVKMLLAFGEMGSLLVDFNFSNGEIITSINDITAVFGGKLSIDLMRAMNASDEESVDNLIDCNRAHTEYFFDFNEGNGGPWVDFFKGAMPEINDWFAAKA